MNKSLTQTWCLKIIFQFVVKAEIFQIDVTHFVNAYECMIKLHDDVNREHISTQVFYIFLKMFQNIIMKFSWMMKINLSVDWITFTWRFEIVRDQIIINLFKKFLKSENYVSMFALICSNFNIDFAQQILMFSFKLKSYENCFDLKNAEMFFTHENENHVINLKFDKESSYDSFYALLKRKF